jgi:hypothetical protein
MPDSPYPAAGAKDAQTDSYLEQISSEYRQMLRYSLAEGLAMDDQTRIAISAIPQVPDMSNLGDLLVAHLALSKLIAPATPRSLEATEPARGALMGSLRRPPLIMWMIIIGIVAAAGFVITEIFIGQATETAVTGNNYALERLNWCFAAALGAVFYVLFTAHGYVKDRTFDPRYNSVYIIRFVLGLLSGLILATVLGAKLFAGKTGVNELGPSVIALLGGFSSEAVYQILQRLVDMLLATVRGDDSTAARDKAAQDARTALLTLADDPAMPENMKSKILAQAKKVGQ